MSEFTVDSADLAIGWLNHHRDLWADAYSVSIVPAAPLFDPRDGRAIYGGAGRAGFRTVISVQGRVLTIPDGAISGTPDGDGYVDDLLIVSNDLAVTFTVTPDSSKAVA